MEEKDLSRGGGQLRGAGKTTLGLSLNFPLLILTSPHLGAHRRFLSLLAGLPVVGVHPTGLQALQLPSLETEEKNPETAQREQWLIG